jgi:hypothetical protein
MVDKTIPHTVLIAFKVITSKKLMKIVGVKNQKLVQ